MASAPSIKWLSVLDTVHDFGKELSTNRYYRAFLSSQGINHYPNPESLVEDRFGMKISEIKEFETLDIRDILGNENFCLLIQNINNEAFKTFLGTLISQNEGGRIEMITDTTNLSQSTLCSIEIEGKNGTTIVTDTTKFDRGRYQAVDNKCVKERDIPVSLNRDNNLFALNVIRTSNKQVVIEYVNGLMNEINLDEYIKKQPGKLPYYIKVIRALKQGSLKKTSKMLAGFLKDLEYLYGLKPERYLSEQGLANILFDLKRSGDQLQVKTAERSRTLFASNDRISASYAKELGVPTIRTTFQEGDGAHRLRKYYFYNYKVELQESYIDKTKRLIVQKIEEIMKNIELFGEVQQQLQERVIRDIPELRIEPVIEKITEFLNTIRRLRELNLFILTRTSARIEFNESAIQLFKCFTLWEVGEYISNILLFLLNPTIQNYRGGAPLSYQELIINLRSDLEKLTIQPENSSVYDYQQFLQLVSRYNYIQLFTEPFISSRRESIVEIFSEYIHHHFNQDITYVLENRPEFLKQMEGVSQNLVNGFKSFIIGVEDYSALLTQFREPVQVRLNGFGLDLNYTTEIFKSEKVRQYSGILEKIFAGYEMYNTIVFYNLRQSGGKSTVLSKRHSVSKIPSLLQYYQKQYSKVRNHDIFYDKDLFTKYFLEKFRSLEKPTDESFNEELTELIFVFLIKMNLEKDRYLYYETMNFSSSKSTTLSSPHKTPPAPTKKTVKTTKRTSSYLPKKRTTIST